MIAGAHFKNNAAKQEIGSYCIQFQSLNWLNALLISCFHRNIPKLTILSSMFGCFLFLIWFLLLPRTARELHCTLG